MPQRRLDRNHGTKAELWGGNPLSGRRGGPLLLSTRTDRQAIVGGHLTGRFWIRLQHDLASTAACDASPPDVLTRWRHRARESRLGDRNPYTGRNARALCKV